MNIFFFYLDIYQIKELVLMSVSGPKITYCFTPHITTISPKAAGAAPEWSRPHNTGPVRLHFTAPRRQRRKQRDGPIHPRQW